MISIEELTKMQIILLTLLVSFVTSIATGIITTSPLAQAPVSVTQTINRVVERTIETVAPATTPTSNEESPLSKEEEAILASFKLASQAVVEIRETSEASTTPAIIGVIVSRDGLVVAPRAGIKLDGTYVALLSNKTSVPLTIVSPGEETSEATTVVFKLVGTIE